MSISSPGIGSGLDVNSIISRLMQVEAQPLNDFDIKEASYQTKISALGSLQSALAGLQSAASGFIPSTTQTAAEKFMSFSASVADSAIASASASTGAVAGSYSLEVTQLAKAHRLTTQGSLAHKITYENAARDVDLGLTGTLDIQVGNGTVKQIVVDGMTMDGLKDAINAAGAGVTADVTDLSGVGAGPYRLTLTSSTPGVAKQINLSGVTGFEFNATTKDLSEATANGGQAARGYASGSDAISTGTLTLTVGTGTPRQIVIDDTNKTLTGLRDAINAAKAGVTATIVSVSATDARLVLSSDTIGTAGKITLSGLSGFEFNGTAPDDLSDAAVDGGQAAQGAAFKLNGIAMQRDGNTVSDAITGVTLTLAKESATGVATTLTVSKSTSSSLTAAFNALAKAYNDYVKTAHDLGGYDAKKKKAGPLLGNATLRHVQSRISGALSNIPNGATGTYQRLAQLGVTLARDGTMSVDSTKLQAAITANYESVATFAAAFGSALKSAYDSVAGTGGSIESATTGLNKSVKEIDKRREDFKLRLTDIEKRYRKQFTALDATIARMNSTSSYLQQQLSSLSQLRTSNS